MNLKHMIAVTGVGLSTAFTPVFAHAAPATSTTSHVKPAAKKSAHKPHKKTAQGHRKPAAPKTHS